MVATLCCTRPRLETLAEQVARYVCPFPACTEPECARRVAVIIGLVRAATLAELAAERAEWSRQ